MIKQESTMRRKRDAHSNVGNMSNAEKGVHIEKTIATLIEMMKRLDAVLKKEGDALRAMDRKSFLDLQLEKVTVAKNYEQEAQKLIALRANIGKVDDELKKELKVAHVRFSDNAEENFKVLLRHRDGAHRLNSRLVKSARETLVKKEEKYDSSGKMYQGRRNKTISSGLMDTV